MSTEPLAPGRSRFKPGDRVTVDDRTSLGHCRTPVYLRGKTGEIIAVQGLFRDPERLAYHRPGLPAQVLYKVRFRQADVWPGYPGSPIDHLEVDLQENWLAAARSAGPKARRRGA